MSSIAFSHPLFSGLDSKILQYVKPLFESFSCPRGTLLFTAGAPAEYFYVILNGTIIIRYKPYDGPSIDLTTITAGGAVGWSAIVGNPTYASDAIAVDDVNALSLRGESLRALALSHPEAGTLILERLARLVSARWKNADQQVHELLAQSVQNSNAANAKMSRRQRKSKTVQE